jgi:hypothetical protein
VIAVCSREIEPINAMRHSFAYFLRIFRLSACIGNVFYWETLPLTREAKPGQKIRCLMMTTLSVSVGTDSAYQLASFTSAGISIA